MTGERIDYLEQFDLADAGPAGGTVFNALVACLSPEEACRALDTQFTQSCRRRAAYLRTIAAHMAVRILPCHIELIERLHRAMTDLAAPRRKSAASALLSLVRVQDAGLEQELLRRLCESADGTVRAQVYRRLKELPEPLCPDYVVEALQSHGDLGAAQLLLQRAPVATLAANFGEIERVVVNDGYWLSRLYLRLSGRPPADLSRLKGIDAVSHAYVCAKLRIAIPEADIVALYRASFLSGRSGLVIWSAGQMGHWDALKEMLRLANDPEWVSAAVRGLTRCSGL